MAETNFNILSSLIEGKKFVEKTLPYTAPCTQLAILHYQTSNNRYCYIYSANQGNSRIYASGAGSTGQLQEIHWFIIEKGDTIRKVQEGAIMQSKVFVLE